MELFLIYPIPTIAESYSIKNTVEPFDCLIIIYASCKVALAKFAPFIAKILSPYLLIVYL